eukprot:14296274-Alexandrium_andersonii.AAC.1
MSASLVGSEMCIRDRPLHLLAGVGRHPEPPGQRARGPLQGHLGRRAGHDHLGRQVRAGTTSRDTSRR